MSNLADALAGEFVGHTINLQRYSAGLGRKVLALLQHMEKELSDTIYRYDISGVTRDVYKRARAEALLKQVKGTIATAYKRVHKATQAELLELSDVERRWLTKTFNKAVKASVFSTSTTRKDLRELVSDVMIQGSPAKDWWAKQGRDAQQRFATQIRLGVAQGETNDQLVKRIRGQRTSVTRVVEVDGKQKVVEVYTGGIFEGSKREAQALVRTAVQTVSNQVMSDVYEENADILRGKTLNVTLDNRTTLICISLSGGAWDLDGNPLPESTVQRPYPGDPPYHWGCRTFPSPLTKSWDQLIEEQTGRRLKKELDTVPDTTRASMDGEVPGKWDYNDWLESKSAEEQRDILGPGRYKLWKSGKLTLPQLVNQDNRPLTLAELESKYG